MEVKKFAGDNTDRWQRHQYCVASNSRWHSIVPMPSSPHVMALTRTFPRPAPPRRAEHTASPLCSRLSTISRLSPPLPMQAEPGHGLQRRPPRPGRLVAPVAALPLPHTGGRARAGRRALRLRAAGGHPAGQVPRAHRGGGGAQQAAAGTGGGAGIGLARQGGGERGAPAA
jgi:hypothetical protein